MDPSKSRKSLLNILVVCSSGIGTSRLLANRLEQVFSEIERITQAVSDLNVLDLNNYDGIISTVNLDIEAPFLIVIHYYQNMKCLM